MRVGVKASTSPSLSRALRVYHVSTMEELSFNPANFGQSPTTSEHHEEHSPQGYRCYNLTCCHLVFTSLDDESPVRADHSSPKHPNQHHHHTSTPSTEQFSSNFDNVAWNDDTTFCEEHFPTAPLDDIVWSEDPILDRHLMSQTSSVPTLAHTETQPSGWTYSTPQDEAVFHYELIDLNNISSDLPDIMMTTSDEDIPDLEDTLDSEHLNNI